MQAKQSVQILDCTIRDGGYINNWRFDEKMVREVYRAASKAGVDILEIGFRGTEEFFDTQTYGPWRYSPDELIARTVNGIQGARIAVMADFGKIKAEDFSPAQDSPVSLVRVASHKNTLKDAIALLEKIKAKGYRVSLNAMGYTNFTLGERRKLQDMLEVAGLDYIYVADSYGSLFPEQVQPLLGPLLELGEQQGFKVGFHPHNSLQMAFANTLEAMRLGVDIVDSTFYGMGRAAGNLPSEILISYLSKLSPGRYNAIPLLNCIDLYFLPLHQDSPWGYNLAFMLSGLFKCHPNYAFEILDQKRFSIEDIWKAMDMINQLNPVGYDKTILKKMIHRGLISGNNRPPLTGEELEGLGPAPVPAPSAAGVPYANRHPGRNFLILANGPNLKLYQAQIAEFIKKYDPVVLGANYLGGLFTPEYHAFTSKKRFMKYAELVDPRSKLLIGQYIEPQMVAEYCHRDYETIYYRDAMDAPFSIDQGVISTNCATVSVLLLGVAALMGADRVFAAGMDGYLGIPGQGASLFYDEKDDPRSEELNIERHHWCQFHIGQIDRYLWEQGGEGVHILTPTGYQQYYKGIENYL
jgi:4-hydroxy 2-oxovalerate aldolase